MSREDVRIASGPMAEALGHIRNATSALLGADDPTGECLLLGIQGLELQDMLGDVWPVYIDDARTASESLTKAERLFSNVIDDVPQAVWWALRTLRRQVGDGHH